MSFFGLAQYRNSVKMLPCPESRSILGWVIRQSGGAGRLWSGESVGGKCPSHFEYSGKQRAGGLPSIDVTQTRAGRRSNVKPSLSEKAAGHLPLSGPTTNTVDAGQISSFPAVFSRRRARLTEKAE